MTWVWLPDSPDKFGSLPPGIEADVWTGGRDLPDSADQVEYVVLPYGVKPEIVREIGTLPRLKTIQILFAGVDHILPYIPARITLCNARGAHTAATAEWTVGVIIASLRNLPRFALAQRDGRWDYARSERVGGKHVLIVGYGDIGAAVERRLAGWDVTIDRVARHAREGVYPVGELPGLVGDGDEDDHDIRFFQEFREIVDRVDAVAGVPRDPLDRDLPAREAALDGRADVAVTDDQHLLAAHRLAPRPVPAAVVLGDGEPGEVPQAGDDGADRPLGGGGGVRTAGVAERDVGREVRKDVVGAGGEDLDGLEAGEHADFSYYFGLYAPQGQHDKLDLVRALRQVIAAGPDIGLDAGRQGAESVR